VIAPMQIVMRGRRAAPQRGRSNPSQIAKLRQEAIGTTAFMSDPLTNATTVDTAQGSTATEHIHAMPAGSQAIHSFTAYTAASRHERTTWIVVDEASERRQLAGRSMLGQIPDIREADVWRNIGENLSRPWQKHGARHRGTLYGRTLNNARARLLRLDRFLS
jgi:hypothetical protein